MECVFINYSSFPVNSKSFHATEDEKLPLYYAENLAPGKSCGGPVSIEKPIRKRGMGM
jgi:hypothetical protein